MNIAAALEEASKQEKKRCKIQRFLDEIPADEPGRDDLITAVESRDLTAGKAAAVLRTLGLSVSNSQVSLHRRGACGCDR